MCTRTSGKLLSVLMEALSQDTLLAGDESSAKCAELCFSNIYCCKAFWHSVQCTLAEFGK